MTNVTFIAHDGASSTIDADNGSSVMQTALFNGISGIVGECGGGLVCSTCHVYVDPGFADRLSPPSVDEDELLDAVGAGRQPNSRLSCQIEITPDLEGLVVHTPASQY